MRIAPLLLALAAMSSGRAADEASGNESAAPAACERVSAGTVLALELVTPLDSGEARKGDQVALRVAAAVTCGDRIAIPAGTPVHAEVTHAQPGKRWGQPGELMVAGRHLDIGGKRYPIRALQLGGTAGARTLTTAQRAFAPQLGGFDLELPAGTRTQGKLAADLPSAGLATTEHE